MDPPAHGRTPHWVMKGAGHEQRQLRKYVKRSGPWPFFHHFPPLNVVSGGGGKRTPPFWHVLPPTSPYNPPGRSNIRFGLIGKQRVPVIVRGHKVGRLHGHAWKSAAAFRYFQAVHRLGWPAWDPDHRLPVFP